ncbi:hypothetical protein EOL73_03975, partial [Candidatus Saccharibacteria bacterium]|nr:hypothetical protein [Candidatus Saccharibacteria bacterium]
MSVEQITNPSNGEAIEDEHNIIKSLWCIPTDEYELSNLLHEIAQGRKWLEHMGDKAEQFPEIMGEFMALEEQLSAVKIDDWETITQPGYARKATLNNNLLGHQLFPQTIVQPQYYRAETMRILSPEMRIAYIGRELEALETFVSEGLDITGLDSALQEIIFRIRDVVIKDVDFDEAALLSHSKGGRNAMLLYLATEHAYAEDFATTEDIIDDMQGMPAIKQFLEDQLAQAKEYSPGQRKVSDQVSKERLQKFVGADYEEWEEDAKSTEFELTIGVKPDVALKIFGEPINGRLLTATEFSVSGGKTIDKVWERSTDYNNRRNHIDTDVLGYSGNMFLPKLVYGALNSSQRLDKGNGYGEVVLHLTEQEDASFTIGDSMPRGQYDSDTKELCVNEHEARIAAVYNEAQGERQPETGKVWYSTGVAYVEAQLPGVTFEDINYVSLSHFNRSLDGPETTEKMKSVANAVMEHGIGVCLDFYNDPGLT